ncbi:hypothetical protein AZE42_12822 [Rhizopogon vesiculosus]|uniref:Uncharacterized protein n=1 Tax=Rhizopogon vesiculosus TaxID=180088 RepID=A0A1J8QG23_9AGAM|nr:hypothetical protein AZE42_12822 [Rhizopogon vesiculosus]
MTGTVLKCVVSYSKKKKNFRCTTISKESRPYYHSILKCGPESLLKVQLIESDMSPFDTIVNFHFTCVMNFIAFDAVYSLYPLPLSNTGTRYRFGGQGHCKTSMSCSSTMTQLYLALYTSGRDTSAKPLSALPKSYRRGSTYLEADFACARGRSASTNELLFIPYPVRPRYLPSMDGR